MSNVKNSSSSIVTISFSEAGECIQTKGLDIHSTGQVPYPPLQVLQVQNPVIEVVPWESPCPCLSRKKFQDCCLRNQPASVPESVADQLRHQLSRPGFVLLTHANRDRFKEIRPGCYEIVEKRDTSNVN